MKLGVIALNLVLVTANKRVKRGWFDSFLGLFGEAIEEVKTTKRLHPKHPKSAFYNSQSSRSFLHVLQRRKVRMGRSDSRPRALWLGVIETR